MMLAEEETPSLRLSDPTNIIPLVKKSIIILIKNRELFNSYVYNE